MTVIVQNDKYYLKPYSVRNREMMPKFGHVSKSKKLI